jgi:nicotinate phosphoribosyltransferase
MTEANLKRTLLADDLPAVEPLLVDILKGGRTVYTFPPIEALRAQRQADMERLDPGVKRLMNPHIYHVSLTERMWQLKQRLIASMRGGLARA